jgi:hypothetical protein
MVRISRRAMLCGVGAIALGLAGCKSFKEEKSFEVDSGGVKAFYTPPTKKPSFEYTSDNPVTVYLCLEKDSQSVENTVLAGKKLDDSKIIKKVEGATGTVEHVADSKAEFAFVVVSKGKKASVKATIKG